MSSILGSAVPWRRRALTISAARLRTIRPDAIDCSSGKPDASLLPIAVLRRAWTAAVAETGPDDLQYASPEPVAALARELVPRLETDGVPARAGDLVVGSSAQQLLVLGLAVAAAASGARSNLVVAVEEPGYQTAFDTFERAGHRLVGVQIDTEGAVPASLDAALGAGAGVVLFVPRAQNPSGASWSAGRRTELAQVLASHPGVVAIENDPFAGVAATRPGSLLTDRRIDDRVVYVRSFSKAIAPDLRLAVAVARPRLRALLAEAKSFADGWSSRLAQRALAGALADEELGDLLAVARDTYAERRTAALGALGAAFGTSGGHAVGADGVNVWVHLPPDADALEVVERAAELGVVTAPGEPFFLRPGHNGVVRLSVGGVDAARATSAARMLATAAMTKSGSRSHAILV